MAKRKGYKKKVLVADVQKTRHRVKRIINYSVIMHAQNKIEITYVYFHR